MKSMKISNFAKTSKNWLEILLKIKPNEKCENVNFCENLKIWLEILNKKNLLKKKYDQVYAQFATYF